MSSGGRTFANGATGDRGATDGAEPPAGDERLRAAIVRRKLQRKAAGKAASREVAIPDGEGAPLAQPVQRKMESQLGADLSAVRVHTGNDSARAAESLGARAFTDGNAVHFAQSEFAPGTKEGDRLLAHELTHVVQGQGGVHRKADAANEAESDAEVSQPGDGAEVEADRVGDQVADRLHDDGKQADAPAITGHGSEISRKKDESAGAATVKKGASGMLNADTTVKVGDQEMQLRKGTVVKVKAVEGEQLKVTVQSGHEGEVAEIPTSLFQPEPSVANDDETGKPRDDVYQEYEGALWGPDGPTVNDVAQGYIGDCFLMAGMGAVVAQNPGGIKALFEPQTPGATSYNVTLYKKGKDKKLKPVSLAVDTQLPTQKNSDHNPAYANNGKSGGGGALWPALLEKAYAQLMGGYAELGEGGMPGDAMQALTGVESGNEDIPDEKGVIDQFKQYEKEGKAVVAGSIGEMEATKKHPFAGEGGKYHARLESNEGLDVEVVKESLEIADNQSKNHSHLKDDGKGKIKGTNLASGSVEYGSGSVELEFKEGKAPEKAENLEASYNYEGMISKDLKVYANHSYIFERVDGNSLIFKNPWGSSHPNPIPADQFTKLFDLLDTNQAKPDEGK